MLTSLLFLIVIPARAGLRRQDAGANIREAYGPKGALRTQRIIQGLCPWLFNFNVNGLTSLRLLKAALTRE